MTSKEFQKWFDHFAAAFPAVREFARQGDTTDKATARLWFRVLSKCDIGDALAVTNGIAEQELPPLPGPEGAPEWRAVPGHVARLCGQRHAPPAAQSSPPPSGSGSTTSVLAAYRQVLAIVDRGGKVDDPEAQAILTEAFGPRQSPPAARDRRNYEPAFENYD